MKSMLKIAVLALALNSVGAYAAKGSCKGVEKACKAGGHKSKADMHACVDKVIGGETVDGVTADQGAIDSCKMKKGK